MPCSPGNKCSLSRLCRQWVFTSLPQQRILEDVQDMIQRYCRSNRLDITTAVMSAPSRTHKYHQPSIQGKVSFADQPMVKIQLKHVLDIVKMSFDLGIFRGLTFLPRAGQLRQCLCLSGELASKLFQPGLIL